MTNLYFDRLYCSECEREHKGHHITFMHPDGNTEIRWWCEVCGFENIELLDTQDDFLLPRNGDAVFRNGRVPFKTIILDSKGQAIPLETFQWTRFKHEQTFWESVFESVVGEYLKLEDISNRMKELSVSEDVGVLYVWVESPLYGVIYQYNNYGDGNWWVHGTTNGYA